MVWLARSVASVILWASFSTLAYAQEPGKTFSFDVGFGMLSGTAEERVVSAPAPQNEGESAAEPKQPAADLAAAVMEEKPPFAPVGTITTLTSATFTGRAGFGR